MSHTTNSTTASSSSLSARRSGSSDGTNNPFRAHSRDNLPSFADCFQGFRPQGRLGESQHILAASPQQRWNSSNSPSQPRRGLGSGSVTAPNHSELSPLQLTPRREGRGLRSGGAALVSQRHLQPTQEDAPQADEQNDFSYHTLQLTDEESASDDVGTPPRPIEREDESDGVLFGGPLSGGGGGAAKASGDTQDILATTPVHHRPPLHPAISPIYSPGRSHGGGLYDEGRHRRSPPPLDASPIPSAASHGTPNKTDRASSPPPPPGSRRIPLGSDAQNPGLAREGGSPGSSRQAPHRQDQRAAAGHGTAVRKARSLEELMVKHLFPLFGEFLRSLPPKHLEELLLQDVPWEDDGRAHFVSGWRGSSAHPGADANLGASSWWQRIDEPLHRSVMQRVDEIVPPLDDLELLSSSVTYSRRDFAYVHPAFVDSATLCSGPTGYSVRRSRW